MEGRRFQSCFSNTAVTCQVGESLQRNLLILVEEHLNLPDADPQV